MGRRLTARIQISVITSTKASLPVCARTFNTTSKASHAVQLAAFSMSVNISETVLRLPNADKAELVGSEIARAELRLGKASKKGAKKLLSFMIATGGRLNGEKVQTAH